MKRFWLYNAQCYHQQQHSNWLYWYWPVYWYEAAADSGFSGFSAKNVDLVEMDV